LSGQVLLFLDEKDFRIAMVINHCFGTSEPVDNASTAVYLMKALRKCSNIRLAAFFGTLLAFLIVQAAPEAAQVKGTATYRERIALTPDAVFEATLLDLSKADAPAVVVGSVRIEKPGQVPIRFEIPYDSAHVDQSHSYAVRSRILVGQRLLFTTDQVYPVLTRGHGNDVQTLRMVAASKPPSKKWP
jgi:uncharacterized lipoprotein YbaY